MQFLLIHGAGSTGQTWAGVSKILRRAGHGVTCPDLPSPEISCLREHVELVRTALADLTARGPVVLAGHSYGGMVISEAAHGFAPQLLGMVYFDAVLPMAGKSLLEMASESGLECLEEFGVGPHGPFREPSCVQWDDLRSVPKLYVQFTQGPFAGVSDEMRRSVEGRDEGENWQVAELSWGHHAQRERPEETAAMLLSYSAWLERGMPRGVFTPDVEKTGNSAFSDG